MQGKISMDIHLPGVDERRLKESTEKTFQVASTVLMNLEKIKYEGGVEIIKVTLQYSSLYSSQFRTLSEGRPIMVDFKVDFHPLSGRCGGEAFSEKLQVVARWELSSRTVAFYKGKAEVGMIQENYLDDVSLCNEENTTLASAVVQAMRAIIQEKASFHSEIAGKLLSADGQLSNLVEALVGSKK